MKSILLVKTFLGLVEMTFGQVNANFSLPKWKAVKMIFFAPYQKKAFFLDSEKESFHPMTLYFKK